MRKSIILILAAACMVFFAACDKLGEPREVTFADYMKRAVQAQQNYKAQNGFWAGDRDRDGHIGNGGLDDGDSLQTLRTHDQNFILTVGESTFLVRYGWVQGRGNAVFAFVGDVGAIQALTPEAVSYCRYLDKSVDGVEDGENGRVLAYSVDRINPSARGGVLETRGMPQSFDAGPVGACVMLLE